MAKKTIKTEFSNEELIEALQVHYGLNSDVSYTVTINTESNEEDKNPLAGIFTPPVVGKLTLKSIVLETTEDI